MFLDGSVAAHGADVELVDHRRVPRATLPLAVAPFIGEGVDYSAPPMHVQRLGPGGGVGHCVFAIDVKTVKRAGRARDFDFKPTTGLGQHDDGFTLFQFNADIKCVWRP